VALFEKYIFLALLLLCGPALLPLAAQEQGIIRGIILEKGSSQRMAGVTITNIRTRRSTPSDLNGNFGIEARVGDSLVFSKLGFHTDTAEIITLSEILIDMTPTSIRLDAISVQGRNKEGKLNEVMEAYRRQGIYSEGKPKVLGYLFQPLTSLYETFSKSGRQARRFRSYMSSELEAVEVDRIFSRYRVSSLTGLHGEDLQNFMQTYRPSYEELRYWNEYDVTRYIKKSAEAFEAAGRPVPQKLPRIPIPPQQK